MVNNKRKGADLVAKLLENKDKLISTIVVGNAIVNIGFAALLSALFFKITADEIQTAFLTTVVGTIILVIFGDVLPKAIAVRLSESVTVIYSRPLRILEVIFAPIVYILTLILKGIDSTSNMNSNAEANTITEEELLTLIDIGEEELSLIHI